MKLFFSNIVDTVIHIVSLKQLSERDVTEMLLDALVPSGLLYHFPEYNLTVRNRSTILHSSFILLTSASLSPL